MKLFIFDIVFSFEKGSTLFANYRNSTVTRVTPVHAAANIILFWVPMFISAEMTL